MELKQKTGAILPGCWEFQCRYNARPNSANKSKVYSLDRQGRQIFFFLSSYRS